MSFRHSEEVIEGKGAVGHSHFDHLAKKRGKAMKESCAKHIFHSRVLSDRVVAGEEKVVLASKGDVIGGVVVGEFTLHSHGHD
jgi:hypothetical protein